MQGLWISCRIVIMLPNDNGRWLVRGSGLQRNGWQLGWRVGLGAKERQGLSI